jgi:translation initiation factor IF-3
VRVIDSDGKQAGVMPTGQALTLASQRGLDLVEVAPNATPPVCRITDFGKFKYEQTKREREARKHQQSTKLKEIKLHVNIDSHDYNTKLKHILDFLEDNMKVKVSLFFRGREKAHTEYGEQLMQKLIEDVKGKGHAEVPPKLMMGRSMHMLLGPARGARKTEPPSRDDERAA